MRFIHTADWQLGKPFARFPAEVRAALTEARFDVIDAIGRVAEEHGAGHVLVAGDVFDTPSPMDRTVVQALSRMRRYPCKWWLLAGNHDYARSGGLWERLRAKLPANVIALDEPQAQELELGVWVLPAPLLFRHALNDPTEIFDQMQTPGDSLRIGLAHGSVRDFGSQGETRNMIAPDRASRSNLAYLALGDWHGTLEVNSRTWYSGTPETDQFLRDQPGQALIVEVASGTEPRVTRIRTGQYQWLIREWPVGDAAAFDAARKDLIKTYHASTTLLRLAVKGIVGLEDRLKILERLENELAHELRFLDATTDELVGHPSEQDLAELAVEGALGVAANRLRRKCLEGGPEAEIAMRALEQLFVAYHRGQSA